jgi:isopenicillin N synthase-like dioxygenase
MPSIDIQYPRTDFPADLECHPLLVVDFAKVKAGDEQEIDQLYNACTNLGFFYLKNYGVEDLTEPMFDMGRATFSLPEEELLPFEQGEHLVSLFVPNRLPHLGTARSERLTFRIAIRRQRHVGGLQGGRQQQRRRSRKLGHDPVHQRYIMFLL